MTIETRKKITEIMGQSAIEYLVIFAVILGVILATGIRERIRDTFNVYFTNAAGKITTVR